MSASIRYWLVAGCFFSLTGFTQQGLVGFGQEPKAVLRGGKTIYSLAFSPDCRTLASAGFVTDSNSLNRSDGVVELWEVRTGWKRTTLRWGPGNVKSVAFANHGRFLAIGNGEQTLLWDLSSGKAKAVLDNPDSLEHMSSSSDGRRLATVRLDGMVRLWDVSTGKVTTVTEGKEPRADGIIEGSCSVALSCDGLLLAYGGNALRVRLWDVAAGKVTTELTGHTGGLSDLVFSPDGKLLASASEDATARLWDVRTGRSVATLRGHDGTVCGLCFSPDGKLLVSGGLDGTVRLWDVPTGRLRTTIGLPGKNAGILSVALSPDGTLLAAGNSLGEVRLWDFAAILEAGRE